jgi:hypothetical protein
MDAKMESVRHEPPPAAEPLDIDPHDGEVDITLLWHMLSMTPTERLDYHDAMRRSLLEMRRAGRRHYGIAGYDEIDPESAPPVDGCPIDIAVEVWTRATAKELSASDCETASGDRAALAAETSHATRVDAPILA